MNGTVDTTIKTSTPHVADLVLADGKMVAVCRISQHRRNDGEAAE